MESMESRIFTQFFSTLMLLLCFGINTVHSEYYNSKSIYARPVAVKETHLHFYYFDIHTGTHPTAVVVARANQTSLSSRFPFGTVYAIDNTLREGPEETSKVVGNAQGMYVLSSQDDRRLTLVMYVDYAFTSGEFNGSSISVVSRNPVAEEAATTRELAVVGGRGRFRMARGFAEIRNHHLNATTGDGVVEYNVTLFHN